MFARACDISKRLWLDKCLSEVEAVGFHVREVAPAVAQRNGCDDNLALRKVGIFPAVADVEMQGALSAPQGKDAGGLCVVGYAVADGGKGAPALGERPTDRKHALVRVPACAG